MRKAFLLSILICLSFVLGSVTSCNGNKKVDSETIESKIDSLPPLGFWEEDYDLVDGEIRSGETFTGLFTRLGMTHENALVLSSSIDSVFDVRKMRAGNTVHAYYHADSAAFHDLHYVVYDASKIDRIVFQCTDTLRAWKVTRPVEIRDGYVDFTINSSLWNDMKAAGASTLLIVGLSDIFAWTVDFFGLQEGDRFQVLYSERVCDNEVIAVDSLYYAVYTGGGKTIPAIMLDLKDGGNRYWSDTGESLRKAFLKAPLKFTRISSGFSYARKHPVYGTVRPHTAVDYAAPTGTPVMSIGDGVVVSAGWAGGGGNTVKIKHNSVYTTSYMHLSKYAKGIKAGTRVRQGDVIGYVGATGTATGPHLDFRVYKNGTAINPLTMEAPNTDPLDPSYLPALDSVHALYQAKIDSLSKIKPTGVINVLDEEDPTNETE